MGEHDLLDPLTVGRRVKAAGDGASAGPPWAGPAAGNARVARSS